MWKLSHGLVYAIGKCAGLISRQYPIGTYIVDFCSVECGLVIELDGGQHSEPSQAEDTRTATIEGQGFHVLRFWNNEIVEHIDSVVERITREIIEIYPNTQKKRSTDKRQQSKSKVR